MTHSWMKFSALLAIGFSAPAWAAKPNKKVVNPPAASATPTVAPTQAPAKPIEFNVKTDDSIFAVVTHKSGVAARLAHNHLIASRQFTASLSAFADKLNEGSFAFKAKVNDLEVDREDLQKKWYPTIQALGWLKEPYTTLSDSDRETIRENALAADQLDAKNFQDLEAKVEKITDSPSTIGSKSFSKKATVLVTIRGQKVKRDFAANINLQNDELLVEAVGEFKFTEFGIKPYKALMGALGNDDKFNMLVSFRAVKK